MAPADAPPGPIALRYPARPNVPVSSGADTRKIN